MQLSYKIANWILNLSWDAVSNADHYRIMGLSQTFTYYSIHLTSNLYYNLSTDQNDCFIRFKVVAENSNGNVLSESNEIIISCSDIEKFEITALNWYAWTTLAFRSKWVFDLYKVYDKNWLIAETEDPILELLYKITKTKLNEIMVEWYVKKDDEYVLWGISEGIAKLPDRKKSDYKISVIIPVYNAETFLPRTIDSILSSSMTDIEIILVDDGSTDDSLKICNRYAKNFPCISVIQQKNQRVAIARNNWVSKAKGEYLWFVDNDDIVHPYMYENLYNVCKNEKTDIAIATTIIRNDVNSKELCLDMPNSKEKIIIYSYDEVVKNKHNKDNMYFVAVRNKIVKRKVAEQVKFPTDYPNNIILYEDSAYTPTLYSYIDKFALCKDAYYIWDKRKQKTVGTASTMHKSESADDIWKSFIYAYSYPIYNSWKKHKELSNYTNFKRLIESYDKFTDASSLFNYWNEKLKELIKSEKLDKNKYIMSNDHLKDVINKLGD